MQLELEKTKEMMHDKVGLDVLQEEIDLLRQDLTAKSARQEAPNPVKAKRSSQASNSQKGGGMTAKEKADLKEMQTKIESIENSIKKLNQHARNAGKQEL